MNAVRTIVVAAVIGCLVGAVGTAAAAVVGIGYAMANEVDVAIPWVIQVRWDDGTLQALSGDGLVLPTLLCTLLGALVGLVVHQARARSGAGRPAV